jgi:UTP:GlnB (protein PII) uridylyltransferase
MLLAEAGVDVTAARATTIGDRIVDTFYVRDGHGKIVDPLAIARIRRAIVDGLEGGAPGAADART